MSDTQQQPAATDQDANDSFSELEQLHKRIQPPTPVKSILEPHQVHTCRSELSLRTFQRRFVSETRFSVASASPDGGLVCSVSAVNLGAVKAGCSYCCSFYVDMMQGTYDSDAVQLRAPASPMLHMFSLSERAPYAITVMICCVEPGNATVADKLLFESDRQTVEVPIYAQVVDGYSYEKQKNDSHLDDLMAGKSLGRQPVRLVAAHTRPELHTPLESDEVVLNFPRSIENPYSDLHSDSDDLDAAADEVESYGDDSP